MGQRRRWHPTPVLLPGKSHEQRSLLGWNPWDLEELDMTERLHFHFSLSCIGEGNGNPLQSSCLEKPRDGGAWWAAVYGIPQSRTWLKWLSSSSSNRGSGWRWEGGMNNEKCRNKPKLAWPTGSVVSLLWHPEHTLPPEHQPQMCYWHTKPLLHLKLVCH